MMQRKNKNIGLSCRWIATVVSPALALVCGHHGLMVYYGGRQEYYRIHKCAWMLGDQFSGVVPIFSNFLEGAYSAAALLGFLILSATFLVLAVCRKSASKRFMILCGMMAFLAFGLIYIRERQSAVFSDVSCSDLRKGKNNALQTDRPDQAPAEG